VVALAVPRTGPLSNQSQRRTNKSLGPLALQKRKLENFELRLGDETRAFRPEIPERYEPETEFRAANARNFGRFR
jgi:hypothetical protein